MLLAGVSSETIGRLRCSHARGERKGPSDPGIARTHECFTDSRARQIRRTVERGLYNNASEVVREGLRLLREHDEIRVKWREQIERDWLESQRGEVVDGLRS